MKKNLFLLLTVMSFASLNASEAGKPAKKRSLLELVKNQRRLNCMYKQAHGVDPVANRADEEWASGRKAKKVVARHKWTAPKRRTWKDVAVLESLADEADNLAKDIAVLEFLDNNIVTDRDVDEAAAIAPRPRVWKDVAVLESLADEADKWVTSKSADEAVVRSKWTAPRPRVWEDIAVLSSDSDDAVSSLDKAANALLLGAASSDVDVDHFDSPTSSPDAVSSLDKAANALLLGAASSDVDVDHFDSPTSSPDLTLPASSPETSPLNSKLRVSRSAASEKGVEA